jgi:hypothetical protein
VAGVLSQVNPNVRAVFLEDPPWFLGRPEEWGRSIFSKLFSILLVWLTKWRQEPPRLQPMSSFSPTDLTAWEVWLGITYRPGIYSATLPQYSVSTLGDFVMTA